jgi:hypothetical protein
MCKNIDIINKAYSADTKRGILVYIKQVGIIEEI